MSGERQQGTWYQPSLFEWRKDDVRHGTDGEGGTQTAAYEEPQAFTASERERALTHDLMERVCERANLNRAYKRVKANKGAPGVDGMTVDDLYPWLERVIRELNAFLTGWVTYFRYAECRAHLQRLDEWIRRKLRCVRLTQRRRAKPIADLLQGLGLPAGRAWPLARSGKGWWRKAGSPPANEPMSTAWFPEQGLVSLSERYAALRQ